ncbi:MAG: tRNA (N(6)-L-threonylcarbamoyladenosine(37)-C(2))-methylthiotransferase MtaB [Oscillospiraceae bacterium]|nr:tRNA (N(6)-L-threonylcarbamoyladenosine(37)-C(2))-methylthiotransferase MtaB [Oscillospiraceae bacterium]
MNVYIFTLGCKVNQYESQEIGEMFEKSGYTLLNEPDNADIIIVNSCTVTAESVRKVRQSVRHLKKISPNAFLILTGCASQAEPEILSALPEVNLMLGNRNNINIVALCENALKERGSSVNAHEEHETGESFQGLGITHFEGHTRAFLKIQDGCDRFCSYCLIPKARGRSRSKPLADIDRELSELSKNGYGEIVFVGINLSDYGKGTPYSLPDALMLAEKYDSIKRVRLGSLEPDHITDEMIERLKNVTKLCPQFHISLQSGCNSVLKRMNRHYTREEYKALADSLRSAFKDASVTTDILVGFPTESEADFCETVDFAKSIGFEKIHIFPYSKRNGTPAAAMPQLSNAIKDDRAKRLGAAAAEIRKEFLLKQVGKVYEVLFETEHPKFSEGYTKNYTPVRIYDGKDRKGKFINVLITDAGDDYCVGIEAT